jgi:anti-anti-sigma factor
MEAELEFGLRPGVLAVRGAIDLALAGQLRSAIDVAADEGRVLLDLSECTFMDSTGVHAIERATATGLRVEVHGARRPVRSVLRITGIDRFVLLEPQSEVSH